MSLHFHVASKLATAIGFLTLLRSVVCLSRYLPDELEQVIDPVLKRNSFFAHPENLLLAMITDDRIHVRKLGLRRILKARSQRVAGVRKFTVPALNYDSSDYIEMIDWQTTHITVPSLIFEVSDTVIMDWVKSNESQIVEFHRFSCQTQAVELWVKLVTQASAAVCGQTSRDGFIRSRLESRRIMPAFDTKAQYETARRRPRHVGPDAEPGRRGFHWLGRQVCRV